MLASCRRRALLAVLTTAPWFVLAKPARRGTRVACLASGEERVVANLRERVVAGLAAAGLAHVQVRVFVATGEDVPGMARSASEALAWGPDAILAPGPMHAFAARDATRTIPVVFFAVPDPDTLGLVDTLARPGGNLTGAAVDAAELALKRLELARAILPRAQRAAALYRKRPNTPTALLDRIRRELAAAAARLGLDFVDVEVGTAGLAAALAILESRRPDAVVPFGPYAWEPDGRSVDVHAVMRDFERRTRILAIAEGAYAVRQGMCAAMYEGGSQLGTGIGMLVKILKGAAPAGLPVQLPLEYKVAVNRGAARAIGVTLPPSVMIRADLVVD